MLEKELPGIGISIPMLVFWDILGPTKVDRELKFWDNWADSNGD